MITPEQIARRVQELAPWFHDLDLNGVRTAPNHFLGSYPLALWEAIRHIVPEDLSGKTVLDLGCNAGFFSIEMARRGASRVLGVDYDARYLEQARLAIEVAGVNSIELRQLSVYDVAALGEPFDVVLFMGVLYHLRHPLLALDLVREHVVSDLMLFESMCRGSIRARKYAEDYPFEEQDVFDEPAWPKMHFIEHKYAGDQTNWWAPNHAAVEAMARSAGLEIVARPGHEIYVCRPTGERPYGAELDAATGR